MIKIYNTSENTYHLKNGIILKPQQFVMIDPEEAEYLDQSFPNCFSLIGPSAESVKEANDLKKENDRLKAELEALKSKTTNVSQDGDELTLIRKQLQELGISYSPNSKLETLKEKLNTALLTKQEG